MRKATGKPRHHVGVWRGPGILILVAGEWRHVQPDAPLGLLQRDAMVGEDAPVIAISLAARTPTARQRGRRPCGR